MKTEWDWGNLERAIVLLAKRFAHPQQHAAVI
jgi:hypothetical protein